MTLDDLLDLLTEVYPSSFDEHNFAAKDRLYRSVLGGYSEERLEQAWEKVARTWKYNWAPLPAVFVEAMPPPALKRITVGENMKRVAEERRRLKPGIINDWFALNSSNIDTFQASFLDPGDGAYARAVLRSEIDHRAHDVAMARARGRQAQIPWTAADWDNMRGRVLSQRAHRESRTTSVPYSPGVQELIRRTKEQLAEPIAPESPESQEQPSNRRLPYADE